MFTVDPKKLNRSVLQIMLDYDALGTHHARNRGITYRRECKTIARGVKANIERHISDGWDTHKLMSY